MTKHTGESVTSNGESPARIAANTGDRAGTISSEGFVWFVGSAQYIKMAIGFVASLFFETPQPLPHTCTRSVSASYAIDVAMHRRLQFWSHLGQDTRTKP